MKGYLTHNAGRLPARKLTQARIKRRLWEQSKLAASRLAPKDFARIQNARRAELGEIGPDTMLPISIRPEHLSIIVAGGNGTHSLYIPDCGLSRSVTREVVLSDYRELRK